MIQQHPFHNFAVDHMTLCLTPELYKVMYPVFRIIFGITPEEILYEKRRPMKDGSEVSMTFASRIGRTNPTEKNPLDTIVAVVQPSEPENEKSHVRDMLNGHGLAAHWQHIALRTHDLMAFHQFAMERGIQFVTPVLKDEHENLIQVFSGELYCPNGQASGLFFEFLQREPSDEALAKLQKQNKQTWFRDETFLGLYGEKEREYRSGKVIPFISENLFEAISKYVGKKHIWELSNQHLREVEELMLADGKKYLK